MHEQRIVAGLRAAAEIRIDRWGIPHIRASNNSDLYLAQGFNAARDRLWQLDLWRKRGLGLLAADFGPGYLRQDIASRHFLFRGDMRAELHAYGIDDLASVLDSFVAGINAWVALTASDPGLLPPEFVHLGTLPSRWQASDILRIRSHALAGNLRSEVARARVLAQADAETDLLRQSIQPAHTVDIAPMAPLRDLPDDLLDLYLLATSPVQFSAERLAATLEDAGRWSKPFEPPVTAGGSNAWAVAPLRTESGRPILAADPHRTHALPSLRYLVHLSAPGLDVIGAGEPCLPGLSLGHNGQLGFSLTHFPGDEEDLQVLQLHPDDPERYRYAGDWERVTTIEERIEVKGAAAQNVSLRFCRYGPIVHSDPARRRAFAVRTIWSEPGTAAYLGSLACMQARDVAAYERALAFWGAPSSNHVVADTRGDIGWMVAGKLPRRPNHDGLLPVAGDGRFAWDGFHRPDELPRAFNPPEGFLVSSNEMNLPDGYPHRLGFEWPHASRALRIAEVLGAQGRHTPAQSEALQTDVVSLPARQLTALLRLLPPADDDERFAIGLLTGWDCRADRDSAAAALFEVWWTRTLVPAILRRAPVDPALLAPGDTATILETLDPALLLPTLTQAVGICRRLLGSDPEGWAWGRLHHGYFAHPLSALGIAGLDVGPLPLSGAEATVMHAAYRPQDFRCIVGASFRMVLDVGDWDRSRVLNAPGQSGIPGDPHYADLATIWADGGSVPLLYSRPAVDAATVRIFELLPAGEC